MKYYYPLKLKTKLSKIEIADNVIIRPITEEEVKIFFGIKNLKFNEKIEITGCINCQNTVSFLKYNPLYFLSNLDQIFSSNYILETEDPKRIPKLVNILIKLLFPGKSGVYIGFNIQNSDINFTYPNPYWKSGDIANISSSNISTIKEVFNKLFRIEENKKTELIFNYYLNALSGKNITDENRFLNLMTILELMYLDDGKNGELSYRLALRIAKMFKKQYSSDPIEVYREFKQKKTGLYNIRSKIIHSGYSTYLTEDKNKLLTLIEYVKKSILIYLNKKSLFESKNLDKLILSEE